VLEKEHIIKDRTLCVRRAIPKEKMMEQQQDFENDQYRGDVGKRPSSMFYHE
jgi:hypothetical protein